MEQAEAYERLLAEPGVVFLLGGIDTGKTTFGVELLRRAAAMGMKGALVDADPGQSTVGPPTTIGLRFVTDPESLSRDGLRTADRLAFVGSVGPKGHLLPLVAGTTKLVAQARAQSDVVVVDTTGLISGLQAQGLKYYKLDLIQPDHVVAFERGGELEPIVGIAKRFTGARVIETPVDSEVQPRSPEERVNYREQQFAAYFASGASRWKVKPTVFMPTLPPGFDLTLLDGLVVGMESGDGSCAGIAVLDHDADQDSLRMISPVSAGVKGLRLGSIRIEPSGRSRGPVDLRQLFGTE
jgi:polynucleotide 5'-kinase involved in rRNA processing